MGLLDKLKGHKKESSTGKSFDDVAAQNRKRSSSLGRKTSEKSRVSGQTSHPSLPAHGNSVATDAVPTATYPVEGTSTVADHSTHHTGSASAAETRPTIGSDNVSTAAIKDGKAGDTNIDNLSRDLKSTKLSSGNGVDSHTNYTPLSYDRNNFTQTPFNVEAFFESVGGSVGTTTYESVTKPAVVQETLKPNVLEEIHPVFHREHHVIHHQTRIQPVLEQQLLPPRHYVLIDGQKHEITGEAVMNHVVTARDYIPMSGVAPKVVVHQYVDREPLMGPLTGVGASLINKDVMLEHQRIINTSYEHQSVGKDIAIPTGTITKVNYMPGQIPVSTVPGIGHSTFATSSVEGSSANHTHGHSHHSSSGHNRLPVDDAIERSSERLSDQRAIHH